MKRKKRGEKRKEEILQNSKNWACPSDSLVRCFSVCVWLQKWVYIRVKLLTLQLLLFACFSIELNEVETSIKKPISLILCGYFNVVSKQKNIH